MAVRIVVERGPDKGKSVVVDARSETRIGPGPGSHLMIQDPSWQGTLRVSFRQGVCKVTNQTPTTIYLGGKTFAPGEQRTWFHGEMLQPTAQTLLVLAVGDTDEAAGTPGRSAARKKVQLLIILVCLPLAAALFFLPSASDPGEQRSPAEVQKEYEQLTRQLQQMQERNDVGGMARRALRLLRQARFEQMRAHPKQADQLYRQLREEVEADLGTPLHPRSLPADFADILQRVRAFLNQELLTLEPQTQGKAGPGL
jgi:hypothetical protein